MIFETRIKCPSRDVYEQHKYLDMILRPPVANTTRDYTWKYNATDFAPVRRHERYGSHDWQPLKMPRRGERIRFHLRTHYRACQILRNGRVRRVSNVDYFENLEWIVYHGRTKGIDVQDADVDFVTMMISKPGRPFRLQVSDFRGIATVVDGERFEQALLFGMGNAKAYGMGFMSFVEDE